MTREFENLVLAFAFCSGELRLMNNANIANLFHGVNLFS
jgi:hypothetical protein